MAKKYIRTVDPEVLKEIEGKNKTAIPNSAIDELSMEALGAYGAILSRIQFSDIKFNSKEELLTKMLEWSPRGSNRKTAEKVWDELVEKGYIEYIQDENGETVNITYGFEEEEGEQ